MSSGNVKLMPLRGRDEIKLLCRSQRAPHFEKTLPAFSVYSDYLKGPSTLVYVFCGKSGRPKEFPSQSPSPLPRSWSKESELARKKGKQSGKQVAVEGDVHGAVKSTGLIAEMKIFLEHSKEKAISASGPSSTPCRSNPIESGKARDPSLRDHRSHESAKDIIELEVLPVSAPTCGPAQRTRARTLGKRLCSSQHPVFFKKPAVSNFFRS